MNAAEETEMKLTTTTTGTAGDGGGRAPRPRARVAALAVVAMTALLISACGGSSQATALQGRLLSVADLPAGWSAVPVNAQTTGTSPCLSSLPASPKGLTHATAAFVEGTSTPTFAEALTSGPQAQQQWHSLNQALARCRAATITIAGKKAGVTVEPLSFPRVASASGAQGAHPGGHFSGGSCAVPPLVMYVALQLLDRLLLLLDDSLHQVTD